MTKQKFEMEQTKHEASAHKSEASKCQEELKNLTSTLETLSGQVKQKEVEAGEQIRKLKDMVEQADSEKKALAKRIKEKERKI